MLNKFLLEIEEENVFSRVTEKVNKYKDEHPEAEIISLGIGDVSKPINKVVIEAMHKAVDDLADMDTFKGYGAYYGFPFLRQAILENEYQKYGLSYNEIFVGNGTKTDSTSLLELFDQNCTVLCANPDYPIYTNGAKALSRKVYYTELDENYKMKVPSEKYDIIYICSPNNPTGAAYTYEDLKKWIAYANSNNSVIIFDNVYKCFARNKNVPDSIYEIEGSKNCCIELRSFSKTASFTSSRCSYYVLPKELGLTKYWLERTLNRFNGASYVSQRGAEASYLPESQKYIKENIESYLDNAKVLRKGFEDCGFKVNGGIDSPYLWIETKKDSWSIFDEFLKEMNIVVIPGIIFGSNGDHNIRVSALGKKENSLKAIERMKKYYEKIS